VFVSRNVRPVAPGRVGRVQTLLVWGSPRRVMDDTDISTRLLVAKDLSLRPDTEYVDPFNAFSDIDTKL
jgi:hypothetical protein